MDFWAHVDPTGHPHLLHEHLTAVGHLAGRFAERFEAGAWAELAGRWHDLGKYTGDFQRMIREENGIQAHIEVEGGPRDHSTAGAVHAIQQLGALGAPLAFAIAGHHAGLADHNDLKNRLAMKGDLLKAVLRHQPPADLLASRRIQPPAWAQDATTLCDQELWLRLLFSALCDADFLDTEAFFRPEDAARRHHEIGMAALVERLTSRLDALEAHAPATPVNKVRADIRRACEDAAAAGPGFFSLTVPTGGGKTLAGMAFALRHALAHDLDRVIVAIPYTSIIEQNADIYRGVLGADAVIEHHSAFEAKRETAFNRLASENWDAPVVVTTTVQLFESLFARRPGACRKLHRLVRSVIVLDEAQTLPPQVLMPILDVLRALVERFGTTVVFSTATQPAFHRRPGFEFGLAHLREVVPPDVRAFERLKRVQVRWPAPDAPALEWHALAAEVATERDVLAIVHRRADARELTERVDEVLGDASTLHLSALMCPAHRSEVLADIKARKQAGHPVRLVATQLVEAGVDVDFAIVYRALAGLDALAQAAGRCNREGRLPHLGELRVFLAPTEPPPGVLRTALSVARVWRATFPEGDLFAPDAFRWYFDRLYGSNPGELDKHDVQPARRGLMFKTTAERFRMIDNDYAAPLVVPWPGVQQTLKKIEHRGQVSRGDWRALQRFQVQVPRRDLERWEQQRLIHRLADTLLVLPEASNAYDPRFGFVPARLGGLSPESLVF